MEQNDLYLDGHADILVALLRTAPVGIVLVDRDFRFVMINDAAAPNPETATAHRGKFVRDVVPGFWPVIEPIFRRVLEGETILDADVRPVTSDPTDPNERDWIASFYPVWEGDEITGIGITARDVTEIHKVQEALEIRNNLYAMLAGTYAAISRSRSKEELFDEVCSVAVTAGGFKFAWIGEPHEGVMRKVASAGEDDGYIDALEKSDRMITTDPADPRSQGPTGTALRTGELQFVNDYSAAASTRPWQEFAKNAGFAAGAAIPIGQRGEVVAVLTVYAPQGSALTDEFVETLEELPSALEFAMDRFELERIRARNEAGLLLRDRALRAATQGVVITDAQAPDNPIIYASPAFEQLTGYQSEEIIGKNCRFLQGEGTDPATVAEVHAAVAAGRACDVELLNYRKSGESFWNALAIAPVTGEHGEITHFVGVQTDVTDRRKLEARARQAQKMEAVGLLAGGVAHDFNNILTVIRGATDLALEELDEGSARDSVKMVDVAAEHAAELTQQLLAFSRQLVLHPKPTDLNDVVSETMRLAGRILGEDIVVSEQLGDGLDAVIVDRSQLQQVILNLAINARDAMPSGGELSIRTSLSELDGEFADAEGGPAPGTYALIEITDTGVGMDTETQAKVFEPFFTTKSEGTGLGLATVYGIVKQSGGHIYVYSEPGVGTTLKVYLPTTEAPAQPKRKLPDASGSLDGSETILHVEDSEMLRSLVKRVLSRHGYEILTAANSEEALAIARNQERKIDFLLTDVVMPGMNGRELAEILTAENPDLVVLYTSGYPADTIVRQGIAESEVNFIQKPFLAKDLLPLIRSLLDAKAPA